MFQYFHLKRKLALLPFRIKEKKIVYYSKFKLIMI